ncbi:MAG TPA: PfkB family carbohydrate kinase [Conexibacter sp.]|nr:PfkB family carbohydrate kinase [Conexibacter sp.]
MTRVIVVGSVNEDLVVRAPIPAPGETVAASEPLALLPGGKGANAACAAARLGAETEFAGCVGDDEAGERAREQLTAAGVGIEQLAVLEGVGTGRAVVIVDDGGENAIVIAAEANGRLDAARVEAAVAALAVPGAVVLSNLEIPEAAVEAAAAAATAHGLRFVLDPAPARALGDALVPPGAVIVPNEHELTQLGATPAELLARGASAIVVTRGAEGAEIHEPGAETPTRIPAPAVRAVDTTGAGDAFRGALAAELAAGQELHAAVRLAAAAGAHATTAPGARGALGDRAAIEALLAG